MAVYVDFYGGVVLVHDMHEIQEILTKIAEFALADLPKLDPESIRIKRDAADFVSNRDYAMESKIISLIHGTFPDHVVISEEIGVAGDEKSKHKWLVDPIDGTCNDSHDIPWSCVSVAYTYDGQAIAGLVVQPYTREVFRAVRGGGATCNGESIHVRPASSLSGSVIMTELINQRPWGHMFEFIDNLARQDATVRVMGSTALAIMQVAAGRSSGVVFGSAGRLDVAASVLIALEAGAVILKDGHPLDSLPEGRLTIASPGIISALEQARGARV